MRWWWRLELFDIGTRADNVYLYVYRVTPTTNGPIHLICVMMRRGARYTLTDCLLVNSKPIKFYYELFLLFHSTHFIGLGDDETLYYGSFGFM